MSDTVMRPVSELLDEPYLSITASKVYAYGENAPDHGESVWEPHFVYSAYDGYVGLVEIPATHWGDYAGDAVNRSNCRVILSEFADHVVHYRAMYSFESLYLRTDREIPEELYDLIVGLGDYPVADEDDLTELEMELEREDWDSCGRDNLRSEITELLGEPGYRADTDPRFWMPFTDEGNDPRLLDDDALDEIASEAYSTGDLEWQNETAVGGYFRGLDELAVATAERIVRDELDGWAEYARTYLHCEGQTALELSV